MEYTLEDAFDTLKDKKKEKLKEIVALKSEVLEKEHTEFQNNDWEGVRSNQHKICCNLLKDIANEQPKDYPIPKTSDLQVEVLRNLEKECRIAKDLHESMKQRLSIMQEDIRNLEKKKSGLKKMKQAYLDHAKLEVNTNYSDEFEAVRRLFREVKDDLDDVVTMLFPDNQEIRNFLASLTSSYEREGVTHYVDVPSEVQDFVNFLIEADIVTHHRNDKNKVRLMDIL